jgi:hypothetical protein
LHEEPSSRCVYKQRAGGIVSGDLLVGDVRDQAMILLDA